MADTINYLAQFHDPFLPCIENAYFIQSNPEPSSQLNFQNILTFTRGQATQVFAN